MNSHTPLHILSLYFLALFYFCNANMLQNNCQFKGMFVFGSSVVDNGNNNELINSTAKSNYLPYGTDLICGPTGRFSNGKNVADCIADLLQLKFIQSFHNTQKKGYPVVGGVNFASSGSGILNDTGLVVGKVITLHEQITNFIQVTLPDLESQLNSIRQEILPNYLFLLAAGNNDYLTNYFFEGQLIESPQGFAARVVSNYYDQLKRLYNEGARNFLLLSVYPLGCSPCIRKGQDCMQWENEVVAIFYDHLIPMVDQFKSEMPGSKIIVLNSVKVIMEILTNPSSSGFSNVIDPCCELAPNGASCKENGIVCSNRNSYAFFDGQHNTEAFGVVVASKIYNSLDPTEIYPVNLQQICDLPLESTY